jgi:catechol 2,3-dioxygenase-like lactoylglutathione lyase family enzyme
MAISKVQVFSVPVADPERARAFYVDTLGFAVLSDVEMQPGMRWIMVAPPGGQTAITLVTWFESMPAGSLRGLVLETDDLGGDVQRLTEAGVDVGSGVQQAPWGDYAEFADPDGNGLILQQTKAEAFGAGA